MLIFFQKQVVFLSHLKLDYINVQLRVGVQFLNCCSWRFD